MKSGRSTLTKLTRATGATKSLRSVKMSQPSLKSARSRARNTALNTQMATLEQTRTPAEVLLLIAEDKLK